jgi:hypothetical protein
VTVDACNAELRDGDGGGFAGDRASRTAFQSILRQWRNRLRAVGQDPLGAQSTKDISRQRLEQALLHGEPEAAGLVLTAVEEFAQALAEVCRRLLALGAWHDTQRIAIGGGFRASRLGELAIGRASVLLQAGQGGVKLQPIRHDPEQAGLLGAVHLLPPAMRGAGNILAVDIGGTNIRTGLVATAGDGRVLRESLWRHADDRPDRDAAVQRLAEMLRSIIGQALGDGETLQPFVGIGCPGLIRADGAIACGGQNLPGDWEAPDFNLPTRLQALLPAIDGRPPIIRMHNDAVVQGLSELSAMRDLQRWGILTIGTGLGNARFTNRIDNTSRADRTHAHNANRAAKINYSDKTDHADRTDRADKTDRADRTDRAGD